MEDLEGTGGDLEGEALEEVIAVEAEGETVAGVECSL